MSRTFPRAFFRGFLCWLLLFFGYLYLHRSRCASAGAWAPPASSRSVCSFPRRFLCSAAWRCGPFSAAVCGGDASRRVARDMDSNIGQVTGVAPARRTPPGRLAISAGRARPGAARAPRPALETEEYKDGRRSRTKFEATTDATDAPRARPCSSWASSSARSRRSRRPRPAAARAGRPRRRAR